VDVLLRGVDLLNRIGNASNDPKVDWRQFDGEATALVDEINASLTGNPVHSAATPADGQKPSSNPDQEIATTPTASLGDVEIPIPAMFDAAAAEMARQAFVAAVDGGASEIRIDLSKATDIDATGLALLAAIPAQFSRAASRIEIIGMTENLRIVLEATGIDRLYPTGGR
jgi:anti-anti-sigma regulatory factor